MEPETAHGGVNRRAEPLSTPGKDVIDSVPHKILLLAHLHVACDRLKDLTLEKRCEEALDGSVRRQHVIQFFLKRVGNACAMSGTCAVLARMIFDHVRDFLAAEYMREKRLDVQPSGFNMVAKGADCG